MTRLLSALLLLCAAGSVQAQTPSCTYDACGLRIRSRFWSGVSVVQGLVWGFAAVSLTFTIWGGSKQVSASDHLQQAIWFYNRDLGR